MFISPPSDSEDSSRVYDASAKSMGFVMDLTKAWAWRPDVYDGFSALRAQLISASSLTKRDQALIVCATAGELGDSYRSLAWGNILSKEAGATAAAAVIQGAAEPTLTDRDNALTTWIRKVVSNPNGTTAVDVQRLRDTGFNDKEIFEATTFAAFRIAFSTVNDALGIKPDRELVDALPFEVRSVVSFGRPAQEGPSVS